MDKIFQIAVAGSRVYAIGEDGTLQVAYRSDDSLQQTAPPKQTSKSNGRGKTGKDVEVSDDDTSSTDERIASVKQMQIKATKIPDILDTDYKDAEPLNQSIIMGSEPEEDEPEELLIHSSSVTRAKSALHSILADIDKPSSHS